MRGDLDLRGAVQSWIEIGIDPGAHLLDRRRAGGDRVEHLLLALEAMREYRDTFPVPAE